MIAINGVGGYSFGHDIVLFKPYAEYTFYTTVQGADDNIDYAWDVIYGADDYPAKFNTFDILSIQIQSMEMDDVIQRHTK